MGRVIVELLSSHGQNVERRYIFDNGVVNIGRSYSNDIILDDPFISPNHLQISGNASKVLVTDLASENGTQVNGRTTFKNQGVKVNSGDEISIGKTKFKLLLPDHPVEPAKQISKFTDLRNFLNRNSVAFISSLLAIGLTVWMSYMGKPSSDFWDKDFYKALMEYFSEALVYLGILGFITYLKFRKAYFKIHLAVFNIATFIDIFYSQTNPFIFFWFSNQRAITTIDYAISLVLLLAMVWASIRLTTGFLKWKGFATLATIAIIITILSLMGSEETLFDFANDPSYPAKLAPYVKPVFEPSPLDSFLKNTGHELFKSTE